MTDLPNEGPGIESRRRLRFFDSKKRSHWQRHFKIGSVRQTDKFLLLYIGIISQLVNIPNIYSSQCKLETNQYQYAAIHHNIVNTNPSNFDAHKLAISRIWRFRNHRHLYHTTRIRSRIRAGSFCTNPICARTSKFEFYQRVSPFDSTLPSIQQYWIEFIYRPNRGNSRLIYSGDVDDRYIRYIICGCFKYWGIWELW